MKRLTGNRVGFTAHTPKFPKPQTEGFYLILGEPKRQEILDLKRLSPVGTSNFKGLEIGDMRSSMKIVAPSELGRVQLKIYFMTDCYLGLDQELDLELLIE
jgi:hypothetical protein